MNEVSLFFICGNGSDSDSDNNDGTAVTAGDAVTVDFIDDKCNLTLGFHWVGIIWILSTSLSLYIISVTDW